MTGHIVGHLVRRGVQHLAARTTPEEQYIQQLELDAQLYEDAGPGMEVQPQDLLPVFITTVLIILGVASINYTVGQVVSSLTMIESPSQSVAIESHTSSPAYTDEPDAPLEKKLGGIIPDVEVTVVNNKPVTSSLRHAIGHLHRIGGFFGRWRGLGFAVTYHSLLTIVTGSITTSLGWGLIGEGFVLVWVSIGLARLHMAWTHKMITYPSNKPWHRRLPTRKDSSAILLPTLAYAAAQQASILLPMAVAFTLGLSKPSAGSTTGMDNAPKTSCEAVLVALRLFAVLSTYVIVGFSLLLPAKMTLTRIEAMCLPEGEATIVAFDKEAIMGDIDLSARGSSRSLFVQTWKSVDCASKLRVIKLFAKMIVAQIAFVITGVALVVAELHLVGSEKLGIFFKSAGAQLQLMAIEAGKQE